MRILRNISTGASVGNLVDHICDILVQIANSIGEPVLLEQFVALENYQKKYLNDISLTKGYTVGVIEKHESGECIK